VEGVGRLNKIVREDIEYIFDSLSPDERNRFRGAKILISGGAGFLGFMLISFLVFYKKELGIERIVCLDNLQNGIPKWLEQYTSDKTVEFCRFNIISDEIESLSGAENIDYIIHMASIASPIFYRKYPIETLDANVWGLRRLLDYYCDKTIRGFAFFSSSEVYGDPTPENIPTSETYRGNVDCKGPRACYDEAKRFGETLCYLYSHKYGMPITIIRPFNNYGPGMRLNDARVVPDFINAVRKNEDICIYSDGKPTRTYCYVADSIIGHLKCVLHAADGFDTYNIGMDKPEITVVQLAEICARVGREILGYTGSIRFEKNADIEYLSNNPNRRCPDISKAGKELGFEPKILPEVGIRRFLDFILESTEEELIW